ncbi:hypothetical protein [Flavobacterium panacagri]|uniref:hypothetical protein n=1 Tax=Flavobacterium panacagri TaxID=3034146 RepID=UPI0025A6176E|nr:hypothetical protein [Flavobacterium panacagri]
MLNYPFSVFTVFDECFETLSKNISQWNTLEAYKDEYRIHFDKFPTENEHFLKPIKGGAHVAKAVFFKSKLVENKTIMFTNYSDGWITLANYLAHNYKCNHITFYIMNDELIQDDYKCMFVSYKYLKDKERVVSVIWDRKWEFFQKGKLEKFENAENYNKRKIKERLTSKTLIDYCTILGLDIANNLFWKSDLECLFLEEIR